jgi:hypothetical protein
MQCDAEKKANKIDIRSLPWAQSPIQIFSPRILFQVGSGV